MQPRSEGPQTLRSFQIATNPRAQLYAYTDHLGNAVYHFNLLREHEELRIEAQAVVEMRRHRRPGRTASIRWNGAATIRYNLTDDHFDLLEPSKFARPSPELARLHARSPIWKSRPAIRSPRCRTLQRDDLRFLRLRTRRHRSAFAHRAWRSSERRGVCQDFAHIMIADRARLGHPGALCLGLSVSPRQPRPLRRRRHPCLGGSLSAVAGLGRLRSHQQYHGRRAPYPRRGGPRLCRRAADARHLQGRRGKRACDRRVAVEPTQAPVRHEDFLKVARPMSRADADALDARAALSPAATTAISARPELAANGYEPYTGKIHAVFSKPRVKAKKLIPHLEVLYRRYYS